MYAYTNILSAARETCHVPLIPNSKSSIVNSNSASSGLVRLWRIYSQADKVGGERDTGQSHKPCLENWPSRVHPTGRNKICVNL
jgi:hypothetical protein